MITEKGIFHRIGAVFITGMHKSGTTWLHNILKNHPNIYARYEAYFLNHQENVSWPGNEIWNALPEDESFQYILEHYLIRWMNRKWNHWCKDLDRILLIQRILYFSIEQMLLLSPEFDFHRHQIWIDKAPRTSIDLIRQWFPNAKVLYMLRDGRDRAISQYFNFLRVAPEIINDPKNKRYFTWESSFIAWAHDIESNRHHFNQTYCHLVNYEELIDDPFQATTKILNFLDLKSDKQLIDKMIGLASFVQVSGGRHPGEEDRSSFFRKGITGEWHSFFSDDQKALFERIAGKIARSMGYE